MNEHAMRQLVETLKARQRMRLDTPQADQDAWEQALDPEWDDCPYPPAFETGVTE